MFMQNFGNRKLYNVNGFGRMDFFFPPKYFLSVIEKKEQEEYRVFAKFESGNLGSSRLA